jgi:hypothetical protein
MSKKSDLPIQPKKTFTFVQHHQPIVYGQSSVILPQGPDSVNFEDKKQKSPPPYYQKKRDKKKQAQKQPELITTLKK